MKTLHESRANHLMFAYNKHIYIVGGEASKTTEVFDINGSKLICKENINYESVDNPIHWVHEDFLYSFFVKKNVKFVDFLQRINMQNGMEKSF